MLKTKSKRQKLHVFALLMFTTLLTSCTCKKIQTVETVINLEACEAIKKVNYSKKDTPETIRQIIANNAALSDFCEGVE